MGNQPGRLQFGNYAVYVWVRYRPHGARAVLRDQWEKTHFCVERACVHWFVYPLSSAERQIKKVDVTDGYAGQFA